ncbi:hypothetical protein RIF29_40508 [Crotalaria pallida]|uniref:F-box associated beta-propeller type 1 domain-containing protein n=1 Tax=Crotalaria pallida TaxID=3830 RepID=A0AAN9E3U2_CROPI
MGDPDWRKVFSIRAFQFLGQPHGQFVNGSLYWLALRDVGCSRYGATITNMKESAIFSFDLETETHKTLSMPDALDDEVPEYDPTFCVLSDCLCLVIFLKGTHGIWQMKEVGDGESWSQLFTINYEYLQIQMDTRFTIRLLCTSETDDIIVLVDNAHHRAILYNWKDNRVIGGNEERIHDLAKEKCSAL